MEPHLAGARSRRLAPHHSSAHAPSPVRSGWRSKVPQHRQQMGILLDGKRRGAPARQGRWTDRDDDGTGQACSAATAATDEDRHRPAATRLLL